MINVQPDIIMTNIDGEKFSVKANQGKFGIDVKYYETHFKGKNCLVSKISPGRYEGKDSIIIEIVPDYTLISKGEPEEYGEKLENNLELDDNFA